MKLLLAALAPALFAADFKAGLARADITPKHSIWMSGYAARTKPSEGVLEPLHAKALAIEDNRRGRVVIVTTDLIGLSRALTDEVSARVQKQWGLERARLLFNSSHTHTGPVVRANLTTMYDLTAEQDAVIKEYSRQLAETLYTIIGAALGDLKPANLAFGEGSAGFAINRREPRTEGVRIGLNPKGPVDHAVPVIEVRGDDGKLRAVLFGYACHNTTLTGQHYRISGDYAGYAQSAVEASHSGTTALFLMLCGGDQNPNPRGEVEHAVAHGTALAAEVGRVLASQRQTLRGPIRAAYRVTELPFAVHTREIFEKDLQDRNPSKVRRAKEMLRMYDERRPIRRTPYPVQAIRFHRDLTILALGGEVVVDYALRAKREYPGERLVVAAYSNDVMCYIPSVRILREGGYEAVDSMIYYGMPGPFSEDVEEAVFDAVGAVMNRVGVTRRK
jgi:neutral ceramidase